MKKKYFGTDGIRVQSIKDISMEKNFLSLALLQEPILLIKKKANKLQLSLKIPDCLDTL